MTALAFDWLRYFRLLLSNHWTEFDETWWEAWRIQHPLPNLGVFGSIVKATWPPWPLNEWDIFDFFATDEQNLMKLDRKQDLNVLYHVCVFRADWIYRIAKPRKRIWHLICRDIYDLSFATTEQMSTKLDSKISSSSIKSVLFRPIGKPWWTPLLLICWDISYVFFARMEFNESWQEARSYRPLSCLWFWGQSKNQDGSPDLCLVEMCFNSSLQPQEGGNKIILDGKQVY